MKKVLRPICYFLYHFIAKHLPESHSVFSLGLSGKFRTLLTRGIIDSCGKSVDIEKGAKFSPHIRIGHHSGLGINSLIQENVVIGNYVMMGPNVSIYTKNHKTSLEKPMIFQGFEEPKKVTIKDNSDVYIDYFLNTKFFNYSDSKVNFDVVDGHVNCGKSNCNNDEKIYKKFYDKYLKHFEKN